MTSSPCPLKELVDSLTASGLVNVGHTVCLETVLNTVIYYCLLSINCVHAIVYRACGARFVLGVRYLEAIL